MKKYLIPKEGQFYKANLHCHSTVSDGKMTPAELKEAYMAQGYSIIAYTDHDVMIAHPELADENFLPLNGYEMEVYSREPMPMGYIKGCHLCLVALEPDNLKQVCWHRERYVPVSAQAYREQVQFYEDEPDFERVYTHECISEMMKRGRDAGFFVTYNHPAWSKEDHEDYIGYHHMHAMEIVNYGCLIGGYGDYNPAVYDDMLRHGKRIYCVATDDTHHPSQCGGGFVMIKAERLEYRTVTRALEAGHFYSSEGPAIHELWYEDGALHVTCDPAERVDFLCGGGRCKAVRAKEGAPVTEASYVLPDNAIYVRVTVNDFTGKHACTNAYFLDELNGDA